MKITEEKEQECIQLMKDKKITLKDIPQEEQTYNICLEAVRMNGETLEFVKEEFKTEELYSEAIKETWLAIDYIENPAEEIQLMAIKKSGFAIWNIKNPTEEMKWLAIKKRVLHQKNLFEDNYRQNRWFLKQNNISPKENIFKINELLFEEKTKR